MSDCVWEGLGLLPREAEQNVRLTTYHRWFGKDSWGRRPSYLYFKTSAQRCSTFMRFKLGSHDLGIELGRWKHRVPRFERVCRRCDMHELDDERHMIFDCPVFEHLRRAHRHLFGRDVDLSMRNFFAHRDQHAVMSYMLDCLHYIRDHWPET